MYEMPSSPGAAKTPGAFLRRYEGLLRPLSLWVLKGDSRYHWQHEIAPGARYRFQSGQEFKRPQPYRRVSLTFRVVEAP
mgnify:CR=1 FL=1